MEKYHIKINSENDIHIALHRVRHMLNKLSFSEMNKQKVLVAVAELTRNILDHASADGTFSYETLHLQGIRIVVEDKGKGIKNIDRILDGQKLETQMYKGLGLGLSGAKNLMDEFSILTTEGGTRIVATKWNRQPTTIK